MTWKERRTVTILLSVAGALFLALLIVFGMIYREGREEALAGKCREDIERLKKFRANPSDESWRD